MPFQSDKQKRWMYANEPEIAREWSDRYGAMNGGIMDVASDGNTRHDFANFTNGNNINVPTSFQARPQSQPVNLAYITPQEQGILQTLKPGTPHEGPMGIPNYDSFDAAGGYSNPGTGYSASSGGGGGGWQDSSRADQRVNERAEQVRRNYVNKENIKSSPLHKKYNPNWKMGGAKTGFGGLGGNILRGIMSIFGGVPGKVLSMLSRINPGKLRGWNEKENRYNTQKEWEDARTNRRNKKRMDYLSDRKSKGLGYGKKAYTDLLGQGYSDTFEDAITQDYESGMNVNEGPFTSNYLQNLDLSKYDNAAVDTHDFDDVDFDMREIINTSPDGLTEEEVMANRYNAISRGSPMSDEMWGGIGSTNIGQNYNDMNHLNMEIANNPAFNKAMNWETANLASAPNNNLLNMATTVGLTDFQKKMLDQRKNQYEILGAQGMLDNISSEDDPNDPATIQDVENYYKSI